MPFGPCKLYFQMATEFLIASCSNCHSAIRVTSFFLLYYRIYFNQSPLKSVIYFELHLTFKLKKKYFHSQKPTVGPLYPIKMEQQGPNQLSCLKKQMLNNIYKRYFKTSTSIKFKKTEQKSKKWKASLYRRIEAKWRKVLYARRNGEQRH